MTSHLIEGLVLGLHLASWHSAPSLESVNPGLYVRHESGFTAGAFRNSYRRESAYAGWTFETADRRFALTAGAVTGYPARRVLPLLVPSVRLGLTERVAARLAYLPKPPTDFGSSHSLHLSVERQF